MSQRWCPPLLLLSGLRTLLWRSNFWTRMTAPSTCEKKEETPDTPAPRRSMFDLLFWAPRVHGPDGPSQVKTRLVLFFS